MIVFELPKLYARASTGKIKEWLIQVAVAKDGSPCIVKTYGYTDGEKQVSRKTIKAGKNIGRSNETTPLQQAKMDAESNWNKKKDELYVEKLDTIDEENEIVLPMLAHKYKERKHNIKFPCLVQPKLNGVRCLYQHGKFISRKGKEYNTLGFMVESIKKLHVDIPDGEIFSRDMSLQKISSAVKKKNEDTERLEYWIYDQVMDNAEFMQRHLPLTQAFVTNGIVDDEDYKRIGPLVMVPTKWAHNENDIMELHKSFTADGFEGTIIRNADGLYAKNLKRSADLQKLKDFFDDEFEIIGGKSATGNEEGCVVFRCKTNDGKEFDVRPKGSRTLRRRWLEEIDDIIGKQLTVRYQSLSDDGIPTILAGIAIRDYE